MTCTVKDTELYSDKNIEKLRRVEQRTNLLHKLMHPRAGSNVIPIESNQNSPCRHDILYE